MTTTGEQHVDHLGQLVNGPAEEGHEEHTDHRPDSYYVKIALILAALTALETSTYWVDFGPVFLPALLSMMVIKFLMVVSIFMHLKFDNRMFSMLFYSGLILAVLVYVGFLFTFQFFDIS